MRDDSPLGTLAAHFALLSILAIGGISTILPEMHRQAVEVRHWMTDAQFADLFAIAQAAPGPNFLIVTLIGWQAAGLPGAVVATAATIVPSCTLTYIVARLWHRLRHMPWRSAVQAGLGAVTVGLVSAGAFVLTRAADHTLAHAAITCAAAGVATATRLSPLWILGGAAVLGFLGLV